MDRELIEKILIIKAFKLSRGIEKNNTFLPKVLEAIDKALEKIESIITTSNLSKDDHEKWFLRQIFYFVMLAELSRRKNGDQTINYRKRIKELSDREYNERINKFYLDLVDLSEQQMRVVGGGQLSETITPNVVEKQWKEGSPNPFDWNESYSSGDGPEIWTEIINPMELSKKNLSFIQHTPLKKIFEKHFGSDWTSENFG